MVKPPDASLQRQRAFTFGLRSKLLTFVLLTSLAPLVFLLSSYDHNMKKVLTEAAYNSLYAAASRASVSLDAFLEKNVSLLTAEARLPAIADVLQTSDLDQHSVIDINRFIDMVRAFNWEYRDLLISIEIASPQGGIIAGSGRARPGGYVGKKPFFSRALEEPNVFRPSFEIDQESAKAELVFAGSVFDEQGNALGVLSVIFDAAVFSRILRTYSDAAGPGSFPMLVDDHFVLLALCEAGKSDLSSCLYRRLIPPSPAMAEKLRSQGRLLPSRAGPESIHLSTALTAGLLQADKNRPYFETDIRLRGHEEHMAAAVSEVSLLPFQVVFMQPQSFFLKPVVNQTQQALMLAVFVAAVAVLTALIMAVIIVWPISRLTGVAMQVANGDYNARAQIETRDEIGLLASSFNAMTNKLLSVQADLERKVEERTKDLSRKAHELEFANQRLRELDELKTAFLSSVSHELRTPLTSVLGFSKLLRKDFATSFEPLAKNDSRLQKKTGRIRENLDIIIHEGLRLTRLINNVLDLSRIEEGKMMWNDMPVRPVDIVNRVVRSVMMQFEEKKGVHLVVDIEDGQPDFVLDSDRLEQVLINLLGNAIKFTEKGVIRLESTFSPLLGYRFEVSDTGIGIEPRDIEMVFDRFQQAVSDDTLNGKPVGAGLGLAISREIIAHYRGDIFVSSIPTQGSIFVVTLPVSLAVLDQESA
ncbi:ATP-binding protein [Desulfovibrio inopinatus]|uniref:sensor histidine kinase n=1 Tax=Desulfovibrio inopinatus TaxID=102109 RepID=UPI000406ACB4|nr:ATP-binding protein [Desulfovibrio inopinatus]